MRYQNQTMHTECIKVNYTHRILHTCFGHYSYGHLQGGAFQGQIHVALGLRRGSVPGGAVAKKIGVK